MDLSHLTGQQKANSDIPVPTQSTPLRAPVTKASSGTKFQHYKSALTSMQLISSKGTKIVFIGHQFVTCDPDAMEYLNEEIERGLVGITKGELMTREEADPMTALKKQWEEEYKAKQLAETMAAAKGEIKDMGKTEGASTVSPASSKLVAN